MDVTSTSQASRPDQGRDWKIYGVLIALYLPILYPILRANAYYDDDLIRAMIGREHWDTNGRPLTTLLMRMLQCYDRAMVDIAPLPQMAAIAVLAWIGVLIARRFAIGSAWMASLVALPLGAQPFFLQNLSFRFDALSMALAMLLVLLPVLCPVPGRRGWWLGVLWLFLGLALYQPAINLCLLFVLFEVQWAMTREQPLPALRRAALWRVAQILVGMLIYQLLIGMPMISGWVKLHSQKIHNLQELRLLPGNIATFFRFIGDSFNPQWWMYFLPLLIVFVLLAAATGIRYALRARRQQQVRSAAGLFLVAILLPLLALLCLMGPMLALLKPFLEPRALIGVGAWLSTGLLGMYGLFQAWRLSPRWALAAGWMLAIGMMVTAGGYGNALSVQARYESGIATRLADDYAAVQSEAGTKVLLLDGTAAYAPLTRHAIGQLPLLGRLIRSYLKATDTFTTPLFLAHYMPGAAYIQYPEDANDPASLRIRAVLAQTCGLKPLKVTAAYDMYAAGPVAVAVFHQDSLRRCDLAADADAGDIVQDARPLHTPF